MATKSTRKKISSKDKKSLINKLDKITSNVAKKGVYVVSKIEDYYVIKEGFSAKNVLVYFPTKSSAEGVCVRLNRQNTQKKTIQKIKFDSAQRKVNRLMDYFNEAKFYRATLHSKKTDTFQKEVAWVRLSETVSKIKYANQEVANLF